MIDKSSILITDDHSIVRVGIQMLLNMHMPNARVMEASSGPEMLSVLKKDFFDIVILDINMPNTDTHSLLYTIKTLYAGMKILIYSMSPEDVYALRFIQLGVHGYLSKEAPSEEIIVAIQRILAGERYFSPKTVKSLTEKFNVSKQNATIFDRLSPREFEIMSQLLMGKSIKEISSAIKLHSSTIGTHKARIFNKLHVGNTLELKKLAEINQIFL